MSSEEFVVTIPMPFHGESIVDGVLVHWLIEPGDRVSKGQNIAEIETEKSVWEFEAPCAGEVVTLRAAPGDVVEVKAPLLEIRTSDRNVRHLLFTEPQKAEPETSPVGPQTVRSPGGNGSSGRLDVSPRVRKFLLESGIDDEEARRIPTEGRLTVEAVEAYLKTGGPPVGAVTSYLAGIGAYTPERVVRNDVFTSQFDGIDEDYIEKVTGIRERRWVNGESTSDMAYAAAKEALESSNVSAADIDMIILATTTPDMPLPATSCLVQQKLGCRDIPAFDLQAACSGWLYGLSIAQQFLKTGTYRNILVVASEAMSRFTDPSDRATAFLFGDGAGAAVVSSQSTGHELSETVLKAYSSGYDIIYRKAGGAIMPPRLMESPKDEYWFMDGGRMFRSAVDAFTDVIQAVSSRAKTAIRDFNWFVPHQANERILKSVASRVKALPEKFFSNIRHLGNTSAASIPLALKDLARQKKVKNGDRVLLCAVGAGLTSAGAVLTWKDRT
ncbi:MAG: beta-ketoacyl-ACP synthase 3 [Spirochaetales bacterium]|nr:beta-ketoacyl-ACP synthase 3 [Spirochaetales bacterium]